MRDWIGELAEAILGVVFTFVFLALTVGAWAWGLVEMVKWLAG